MVARNKKRTWRLWLNIFTLVALGVLIIVARPDIIHALENSKGLNIWALLAMVPILFLFYWALAKFFLHFFKVLSCKVGIKALFSSMIELNFVNHVFPSGGISGFSYLNWRLRPHDVSTARSTLSQLGRYGFAFIVYVVLMFVSLFLLAIEGKASSLVILMISIIVVTLIFCTLVLVYVIGSKNRIVGFTRVLAGFLNKLIHVVRRKNPETIKLRKVERTFMELHEDFVLLKHNILEMRWAFVWITLACIAELGLLYAVFVAHGVWVNPGVVVVALVVASTAGLIAVLPGGLGIFEPLMSAIFIAMGVPPGLAVSVTLVFRIITLLLTLVTGYPLYQKEIVKYGKADI